MRGLVGETIQDFVNLWGYIRLALAIGRIYIVMMIIVNNDTDDDVRGDKTMITIDSWFGNKDGFYCD